MPISIPRPTPEFTGLIDTLATDSEPLRPTIDSAPNGAPNVVVVMFDDVGFGAPGTFGGPIPTPALDWVADCGYSIETSRGTMAARKAGSRLVAIIGWRSMEDCR